MTREHRPQTACFYGNRVGETKFTATEWANKKIRQQSGQNKTYGNRVGEQKDAATEWAKQIYGSRVGENKLRQQSGRCFCYGNRVGTTFLY